MRSIWLSLTALVLVAVSVLGCNMDRSGHGNATSASSKPMQCADCDKSGEKCAGTCTEGKGGKCDKMGAKPSCSGSCETGGKCDGECKKLLAAMCMDCKQKMLAAAEKCKSCGKDCKTCGECRAMMTATCANNHCMEARQMLLKKAESCTECKKTGMMCDDCKAYMTTMVTEMKASCGDTCSGKREEKAGAKKVCGDECGGDCKAMLAKLCADCKKMMIEMSEKCTSCGKECKSCDECKDKMKMACKDPVCTETRLMMLKKADGCTECKKTGMMCDDCKQYLMGTMKECKDGGKCGGDCKK